MNNPDQQLKILSYVKRWGHHTQSGGYDRLADFTGSDIQKTEALSWIRASQKGFPKLLVKLMIPSANFSNHYHFKDAAAERKMMKKSTAESYDLIHALYAEDQLNFSLSKRHIIKAALVGTFHLPMESQFMQKMKRYNKLERYKNLDAIVVLSSESLASMKECTGNENVFFVPHGIDTERFTPSEPKPVNQSNELNILTVGRHGRDWETFINVVKELNNRAPNINISAVVPEKLGESLKKKADVTTYSSISERKLIELYRKADLLYMPLNYATANNSILESLACGTPVLSTDTGGIPNYVNSESGFLVPQGDVRETIERLTWLVKNREVLQKMSNAAREQSLRFDWNEVANQMQEVYKKAILSWNSRKDQTGR